MTTLSPVTPPTSRLSSIVTPSIDIPVPKFQVDFKELRAVCGSKQSKLTDGRQAWYERQAQKLDPNLFAKGVRAYVGELLASCDATLCESAQRGQSSVTISVLEPRQTQGWKYADYAGSDEVRHSVWDYSMDVSLHQTRIRGAEIVVQAIQEAGGIAEIIRDPADGPDCFVESVRIMIQIQPSTTVK